MFKNSFASKSFLVIDDFGDMRNMLKGILRMLGASAIDSANNGEEAVDAISRKQYDIVLCDYNLGPGKDGQQVLEEARHRRLISMSTVFIMVTAENTRQMVMGAIEYEPDGYLSKPFSKDIIRARIERVMNKKEELVGVYQALDKGQFDQAIQILDKKLARAPKNTADLLKLKAETCMQAENYPCASEIFENILAVREVPWAKLGLGKVLYYKKLYNEAIDVFQDLTKEQPDLAAAMDWLARCYKAKGQLEDAKNVVQTAIRLSPKAILRQQMLGDLCLQTGDFENAEKAFTETVRQGRNSVYNHPSMYSSLAKSKTNNNKHDEAMNVLGKIDKQFEGEPDAQLYKTMAESLVQHNRGDKEAAEAALGEIDKLYNHASAANSGDLGLEFANLASKLGHEEKARQVLTRVIQNNHDNDEFLQNATETLKAAGLSDDPEDFVAGVRKEVVEMNNNGVKLLQQGNLEEASELFRGAATQMPGNRIINLNAARVLVMLMEKNGKDTSMLSEVRQYVDRLKKMAPDDDALKKVQAKLQKLVM